MINKKTKELELILIFLVIGFVFTNFLSAEEPVCAVVPLARCGGDVVMRISDVTNAHGANASESSYSYVLCCDNFVGTTGSLTCTGKNKLLGLSSTTNAHAESPAYSNYSTNICYDGFYNLSSSNACYSAPISYVCGVNESEILYLSGGGNAHLANASYSSGTKICCERKDGEDSLPTFTARWNSSCTWDTVPVDLIVEKLAGSLLQSGDDINYTIYRVPSNPRSYLGEFPSYTWKASRFDEAGYYSFNATDVLRGGTVKSSNTIEIKTPPTNGEPICSYFGITSCADYEKLLGKGCTDAVRDMCNSDNCDTITKGNNPPRTTDCVWIDNKCESVERNTGSGCGGYCIRRITTVGADTCEDDGFLDVNWDAKWITTCGDLSSECKPGSQRFECPAQIPLPFFDWVTFALAVIVIALVYTGFAMKKNKRE